MVPIPGPIEKQGAGLLLVCDGKVLLLLRANTKHNLGKWGLPGGNVEPGDATLLDTARREAEEEMGALPPFKVLSEIKTARGKRGQKHYSVFIAEVDPTLQDSWIPVLNSEHSHFQWCLLEDLNKVPLHPVVSLLVSPEGYQTAFLKSLGLKYLTAVA